MSHERWGFATHKALELAGADFTHNAFAAASLFRQQEETADTACEEFWERLISSDCFDKTDREARKCAALCVKHLCVKQMKMISRRAGEAGAQGRSASSSGGCQKVPHSRHVRRPLSAIHFHVRHGGARNILPCPVHGCRLRTEMRSGPPPHRS